MFGFLEVRNRHLMRAPGAFNRFAIHELRAGPALRRAEDDHRPARPLQTFCLGAGASGALDVTNLAQNPVEGAGKALMHARRIVALDEMRIVTVASQQFRQLLTADTGQHGGVGDLEPVQMKDRKHRAIARRVQKFVGVPTGGERAGFRFAVAYDATDDQIRIVERRAIGVRQRITEFAAFMNGARSFRRYMAGNSVRPGELAKQPLQPIPAALDRRITLGVRSFEIAVRHDARAAVARTNDVDHVQIIVLDQPVEMDIEEIQSCCRSPVTEQAGLDVFEPERGFEQRIVLQIDLSDRKVIRRAPISMHLAEQFG
jgi:hypothetical protein